MSRRRGASRRAHPRTHSNTRTERGRGRRSRPVASVVVLAALAVAVATGLSAATDADRGAKNVSPLDEPQLRAAARRSVAAGDRRADARDTSDARSARSRSRTRYSGASDREALAIARDHHPELIDTRAFRAFRPSGDDRVERYLDHDADALVAVGDGENVLVESTLPLRGRTADGNRSAIDLALVREDGRFEPKSSPIRASLPPQLGDGLDLPYDGGTLTVHATGADAQAADAPADDKLFYANAARDTDVVATALPTGAELSDVLRSADSPEEFGYRFDGLPDDAALRLTSDRHSAEIVAGEKRLAVVRPPTALDDDGVPVPVTLAVKGRTLELSVAHRDLDVAYPLVLDPVVETFTWTGASNNDFNGWTYTTRLGPGSPPHTVALNTSHSGGWGNGLYSITNGGYFYSTDEGIDRFVAPGDAYVYRADFNNVTHQVATGANMCVSLGIFNNAGGAGESPFYVNCTNFSNLSIGECVSGTWPGCNAANGTAGNDARLSYWAWGAGTRAMFAGIKYQAGAVVYVNDRVNPTVQWSGDVPDQGWSGYAGPFAVQGEDSGLGVKTVAVSAPATAPGWAGSTLNTGCNGTRANRAAGLCNNPKTLNFDIATLPEGLQTLRATTTDAVGNAASFDYALKVDRTAPTLTETGTLKDAANGEVDDGRYGLHVVANDGSPRAGVQSIEVKVDGTAAAAQTQACPSGSCNMTLTPDFVFDGEQYADGEHKIQVTAIDFAGNTTTHSWDVTVGSSAADHVGPGDVNLKTGNLSVEADDVSVETLGPGLGIDRTYNSRPSAADGISAFGPGWSSSLPVDGGSSYYTSLTLPDDVNPNVEVATADGNNLSFAVQTDGTYEAPHGSERLALTYNGSASQFELTDTAGNMTTFQQTPGAAAWMAWSVRDAGTNRTTNLTYDPSARARYVVAPAPTGVSCGQPATALVTRGCRTLTLTYATSTTATGTASGTWGDYVGRVARIDLTAWDPTTATMVTNAVSQYQYDSNGRLRSQWDPRISPALKTTYDYDAAGHMTSLTPPGMATWTMTYASIASDPDMGRFKSVSRSGPNGTATMTAAYSVPLSGTGAPYAMGSSSVAAWGQTDLPATATAIFPADQVPANPPASYTRATVHYLDGDGHEVNVAKPGGRISTTEYDEHHNTRRELTAANRERALAAGASSATRAAELDTQSTYSSDGTLQLQTLEPMHSVELANGQVVDARRYTRTTYDEGAPGGVAHSLATTVKVGARVGTTDADERTTKLAYDGQSNLGWTLNKPTSETIDAVTGGLNLKTVTVYDPATGDVVEKRQPANPNGGDARSTQKVYYSAGANAEPACASRPEFAGLLCRTKPAVQPPGLPNLPVTTVSYNRLNQVVSQTDVAGSATRTTTTGYDAAGRMTTQGTTASEGPAVPTRTTTYNASNGKVATISATDGILRTISMAYDTLGRETGYTDADGVAATMTYDLLDRPLTTNDGKGTQTRAYDATTGDLTSVQDSAAGTLTATYGADAELLTQTLPNGLQERNTYDETGDLKQRKYEKVTNCSTNCTWLDYTGTKSIHGQWLTHTGSQTSRRYYYDGAGRLTQTRDTPTGLGCTVRDYGFDADSNRTSERTHAPGAGGVCDPGSTGTTVTHSYDTADRLVDAGTVYGGFGNETALSSQNGGGSSLALTYYADGVTASLGENGATPTTFARDPVGRERQRAVAGNAAATQTSHFADDSDNPTWTASADGLTWQRSIPGIDGDLAATVAQTGAVSFQLRNLHDDISATATSDPMATGPATTSRKDEFGKPQAGPVADYGYLGAKRRRALTSTGVLQMGLRTYMASLGRFTGVDPVEGGSANAYDYVHVDPVNGTDLTGEHDFCRYAPYSNGHLCIRKSHFGVFVCDDQADGHWVHGWVIQYEQDRPWYLLAPPHRKGCSKTANLAIQITRVRVCTQHEGCLKWYDVR